MKIVLTNLKFEKNKITNFRRQEHIGLGYIGANIKLTSLVIIIYLKGGLHKLSYTTKKGNDKGRKEVAKKLKKDGIDFNVISKSTGFSKEEIEKL
jgi:hypothetical protein